jgi:hypothetical protein|tara:strand:+ start:3032 stop:3265 length:234 start_codon:yes stop_codon:yes gene_type:complete
MLKIDLHGLSHKRAVSKVEECLILNSLTKSIDIELITGKSKELQDKIIAEILVPLKYDYYIPPHNTGIMLITDNELL